LRPTACVLLEVDPVPLLIAFNEHAEKLKRNCRFSLVVGKRERIDRKIPRLLSDIQIAASKIEVSDWKLPPMSKMNVSGAYFCAFCRIKLQK